MIGCLRETTTCVVAKPLVSIITFVKLPCHILFTRRLGELVYHLFDVRSSLNRLSSSSMPIESKARAGIPPLDGMQRESSRVTSIEQAPFLSFFEARACIISIDMLGQKSSRSKKVS